MKLIGRWIAAFLSMIGKHKHLLISPDIAALLRSFVMPSITVGYFALYMPGYMTNDELSHF